jgi:hypothetical protein
MSNQFELLQVEKMLSRTFEEAKQSGATRQGISENAGVPKKWYL